MNEQTENRLYAYEENERVTAEIEKIFSENVSNLKKMKKLKALRNEVSAPISRQHIEYFIKKINAAKRRIILKFISTAVVTAYLIFTLFRIYWYYKPEYNPFHSSTNITIIDLIVYSYFIPIILIVVYAIKSLLKRGGKANRQ